MSDLGAIFHVKKNGTQYDAHAYTTLEECPFPNLKINFNGTKGFVKLYNHGNVPCYVKTADGGKYQVNKEFVVPTGSVILPRRETYTFVVPGGVKVIECEEYDENWGYSYVYVGVKPGSTHILYWNPNNTTDRGIKCRSHNIRWTHSLTTSGYLRWSPQINNHAINVSDYNL